MYPDTYQPQPDYTALWTVVGVVAVACAIAGGYVGRTKGRESQGFFLGLLLGPLGLLAIVGMAPVPQPDTTSVTHRECPHCKEPMRRDAAVCPHCRHESAAWTHVAAEHRILVNGRDVGPVALVHEPGPRIELRAAPTQVYVSPGSTRVKSPTPVDVLFVKATGSVTEGHSGVTHIKAAEGKVGAVVAPFGWLASLGEARVTTVNVLRPGELGPPHGGGAPVAGLSVTPPS